MHTSVIYKQSIFIFGGIKENSQPSAELHRLSLDTFEWVNLGRFTEGGVDMKVCGHCAGIWNNRMIVYGGVDASNNTIYNQFFVYNFEENSWGRVHEQGTPRFCGNMVIKDEGKIMLIGGCNLSTRLIPSYVDVINIDEVASFIEILE